MLCNKQTKLKLTFVLTAVVLAVLSWPITSTAQIPGDPNLLEEPHMPGTIEGTGTYFEVNDSNYLNIALESSEPVHLILESVPEMVVMDIEAAEGATSTQITLSGFLSSTTYYKYDDDYHNGVSFTTDDNGSYTFTQDLSQPHLVFIQPNAGTKFIPSDTSIGTWNDVRRIFTLTTDVSETIQIDEDNLTLNGNGYTVTGSGTGGVGIRLSGRTGVTVENVNIQGFNFGIFLTWSNNNTLTDNTVSNNGSHGIRLDDYSSNNTLTGNTANANGRYGIRIGPYPTPGNILTGNIASNNGSHGIWLQNSDGSTLTNNTASNNKYGIWLQNSDGSTLTNNTASNNSSTGIRVDYSSSSTLTGNTASNNKAGIVVTTNSDGITLTNNTASNNVYGIVLGNYGGSILTNNTSSNNGWGIYIVGSNFNQIYNNNFLYNTTQAYVYDSSGNIFNQAAPIGGNYWSDWTTPDDDGDGFVDYPYVFTGGQDDLPWARQDGWFPPQAIQQLIIQVIGLNLQQGIENSLDAKLDAALGALDDINNNNDVAAINTLEAFINAVEAQSGDKIPDEADADALIAAAQEIIDVLSTE